MIGASDGTNNRAVGGTDKNNVATSVVAHYDYTDRSLNVTDNDTQTDEAIGTIGSFAANSFAAAWTTNNATATQICFITFGSAVGVTVTGITALAKMTANVPKIGVGIKGVAASTKMIANVPKIGVGIKGVSAVSKMAANVPKISVSFLGVTAIAKMTANVPEIGVSFEGITAVAKMRANVPYIFIQSGGLTQGMLDIVASLLINDGLRNGFDDAYFGVGDSDAIFESTQQDLQGASTLRKAMMHGYPKRHLNEIIFRALFDKDEANWTWKETAIFNELINGDMLSREVVTDPFEKTDKKKVVVTKTVTFEGT